MDKRAKKIQSRPDPSNAGTKHLGRPVAVADAIQLDPAIAAGVHLVVDGVAVPPCLVSENELRFLLPADAAEMCLVSPSFAAVPDVRSLGVIISALAISDGAGWRAVALDHPGLYAGLHDVERGGGHEGERSWRWTNGEAHLSASLLEGMRGPLLLRLTGLFTGLGPDEVAEASRQDEQAAA